MNRQVRAETIKVGDRVLDDAIRKRIPLKTGSYSYSCLPRVTGIERHEDNIEITTEVGTFIKKAGQYLWRPTTRWESFSEAVVTLVVFGVLGLIGIGVLVFLTPDRPKPPVCYGSTSDCDSLFEQWQQAQDDARP